MYFTDTKYEYFTSICTVEHFICTVVYWYKVKFVSLCLLYTVPYTVNFQYSIVNIIRETKYLLQYIYKSLSIEWTSWYIEQYSAVKSGHYIGSWLYSIFYVFVDLQYTVVYWYKGRPYHFYISPVVHGRYLYILYTVIYLHKGLRFISNISRLVYASL